jgi:acyl carrier protein
MLGCESRSATSKLASPAPATVASATSGSISDEVISIIATQFDIPTTEVVLDKPLLKYGQDELNIVEIVHTVERRLKIKVPDDKWMNKDAPLSTLIHDDFTAAKLIGIVEEVMSQRPSVPR